MKKVLSMLLAGIMLAGCGAATSEEAPAPAESAEEVVEKVEEAVDTAKEAVPELESVISQAASLGADSGLKILSPSGAPALSLLPASAGGFSVDFVDGADPLQAALVNPEPEYDVIVAPSNLGMKLAESGKSPYKMLGIVTWGNLYIVGKKDTAADPATWTNVASFGEQSVTGKVFSQVYGDALNMDAVTWYNSTAEASAALISGAADVAMLAEPNATASIAKAKENGVELSIIDDVQAAWGEGKGFPQAAVFVKEDSYAEKKEAIDSLFGVMSLFSQAANTADAELITTVIDNAGGAEKFGIPNSQIAGKVWQRLNINVVPAKDYVEDLKTFGAMFDISDVESVIVK